MAYEAFIEEHGPGEPYGAIQAETLERLGPVFPPEYLAFLQESGLRTYMGGAFRTVDPLSYEAVRETWLPNLPSLYIFAMTAFGTLMLWDGERVTTLAPNVAMYSHLVSRLEWLFDEELLDKKFVRDVVELSSFRKVARKLGLLQPTEIYGYKNPLSSGGAESIANLARYDAPSHLARLGGLATLKPF
ncbi:MAG: DUF1851 domain-containing protein [Myxococcales bacterium]|nr:DUF1851 domain-containing protein [Myxococcales bacterium]